MTITVAVIDDHDIVRFGIVELLRHDPEIDCRADFAGLDAAQNFLDRVEVDVLVLDLNLGSTNGLASLEQLLHRRPGLQVLVMSMLDERVYARQSLALGARGYLQKDQAASLLPTAIREVASGSLWVSDNMWDEALLDALPRRTGGARHQVSTLSPRELEVLVKIQQGLTTKGIAFELGLSPRTVDIHRANIKRKLGLRTTTELMSLIHQGGRSAA